jgi:hypothetical protein
MEVEERKERIRIRKWTRVKERGKAKQWRKLKMR